MGMKRSQNMSNQEKTALRKLRLNKNVNVVINDTDKNVGPACADKTEVIEECRRQLYEKQVYNRLTQEEASHYSSYQKTPFKYCEQTHNERELFKKRVRISAFKFEQIQHSSFLYHLKNSENPIVGRPIVAGYNWIRTPESIFVGHYPKISATSSIQFYWIVQVW
jgi:hypothetical protein